MKERFRRLGIFLFISSYFTVGCYWLGKLGNKIVRIYPDEAIMIMDFWFVGLIITIALLVTFVILALIWTWIWEGF